MSPRTRLVAAGSAAALAVTVIALIAAVVAFPAGNPAGAAPLLQPNPYPTPTLFPSDNTPYALETVGGEPYEFTVSYAGQDAFTLGETTVISEYPRGMVFTIAPESANGAISDVTLYVRYVHDVGERFPAEWDAEREAWVAHPWGTGGRQPAWTPLRFHWRVRDESGAYVDTEKYDAEYADPRYPWFRVESDHVIAYWFGFMEDNPDYVAQGLVNRVAGHHQRWIDGFGRAISYKPLVIVYPDNLSMSEFQPLASDAAGQRMGGYVSAATGISVQKLANLEPYPENDNCAWDPPADQRTLEWRVNHIFDVTPHEITHLYQYDVMGGTLGYAWVYEGQAEWFSNTERGPNERMMDVARLGDLPSLTTNISFQLPGPDGCVRQAYMAGASFFNYLHFEYGGMDVISGILQAQMDGLSIYEAVEQVTGKPFFDIENEWRVYIGFAPLSVKDVDPAAALEPYDDSLLAEGDTVTLPAMPPLPSMKDKPGPKGLPGPQCFGGTPVEILTIGALDGTPYYEIDCMGMIGWMTRDQLVGP